MTTEAIQYMPIEKLHESPTNPRKTWGDLKSLAANIGAVGIKSSLP
jgi:hypothetical protein